MEQQNKKTLTLGSLFDGSGGFPLGGTLAGITPIWASEIEPFPVRVTTVRFPNMKHYGDISKLKGSEVEPVDIITFGSPCQDMSVAGKRDGLDGSRSSLFYEAIRIIKEMREATDGKYPRYIVWENVPGAFSSNKGEDFKAVLTEICKIKDEQVSVSKPSKWENAGRIMETASVSHGDSSMLSIGAFPREDNVSTLSQILMEGVPEKYYLSPKACQGILRRASSRGKELPVVLKKALEKQAMAV
nr:DNA cytosine methyltransferase [Cellulosilyticum ruminicola]